MGLLRFLLAVSVLIAHSGPLLGLRIAGGDVAVQIFFIISGFYMSLILARKYPPDDRGRRLFWQNRILRLFPAYLVVLLASVLLHLLLFWGFNIRAGALAEWLESGPRLDPAAWAWLALSNMLIVGQDVLMFLGLAPGPAGELHLTPHAAAMTKGTYVFLFVPQAWTIAVELLFYACAPFLLRLRTSRLVLLIGVSLLLRGAVQWGLGWNGGKWSYGFFPTELALFLAGSLSYRLFCRIEGEKVRRLHVLLWPAVIGLLLAYDVVRFPFSAPLLFGCMTLALPWLFLLTKDFKLDRYIGELSYPFYICHYQIIDLLRIASVPHGLPHLSVYAFLLTTAAAITLHHLIDRPVERYRRHLTVAPDS